MAIQTATWESRGYPKATVTYDTVSGVLTAIVYTPDDLAVQRTVSSEEQEAGISSLAPPTVAATEARALCDLAKLAVSSALESAIGELDLPDIVQSDYYTEAAVTAALDSLGIVV